MSGRLSTGGPPENGGHDISPDREPGTSTSRARGRGRGRSRGRGSWGDDVAGAGGRDPDQPRGRERPVRTEPSDPEAAARAIILRQLTMGARTRAQLQQALAKRLIPDGVAAQVLDRFEAVDLVDDEEFARQWVDSRHAGRGLARRALAHELRHRGVAEETVKEAVDRVTGDDELAAARELVRRKLASMSGQDPRKVTRRVAGVLARKGYSGAVTWQAIREESAALAEQASLDQLLNAADQDD